MSRTDSTVPPRANPPVRRAPRRTGPQGPLGFVWESTLMGWRWLVRMRTALYLLALLGVATLIATVVPQEPNVPGTVAAWRDGAEGPGTAVSAVIDLIGGYDVYGSPAFLALLLLLFLSLTACLIPRIRSWVRLVRHSRPPLTRTPDQQDQVASFWTDRPPAEVHGAARDELGRHHWRLRADGDPDPHAGPDRDGPSPAAAGPPPQVAAEKGLWSREGGSLLFHVSFYVLLAAIVFGQLLGFEGQIAVVEGESFADTPVSYWTYGPGRWFDDGDHAGWVLELDEFEVDWVREPGAPGFGQATTFRSDVTVTRADGETFTTVIEGNRPITVDGMKIHQLDWGYAPWMEVEVDGELLFADHLVAQEDGGVFRAAAKVPAADPDLGLEIEFFPFAPEREDGPVFTGAPFADAPLLVFAQWRGDLQLGRTQQTINELDTTLMEPGGWSMLRPGQEVEMADGAVVRFGGLQRWVGFQVSSRPQVPWLLLASGLLLAGLLPALYAYRRRLWVVAVHDDARGRTLVTVAGRAFQRPQAFADEHDRIVRRLADSTGAEPTDVRADGPDDPDDDRADPTRPAPAAAGPEVVHR